MALIRTQGMQLYMHDGTAITELKCLSGFDLGSDSVNKIDVTCIDEKHTKQYLPGLSEPGEGSFEFNIDDTNPSHLKLIQAATSSQSVFGFYLGGRVDVDSPPTTGAGGTVTLPTNRNWWTFSGSLSTPSYKFDKDSVVACTVKLTRTTGVLFAPKTA